MKPKPNLPVMNDLDALKNENQELKQKIEELTTILKNVELVFKHSELKNSIIRGVVQHALGLEIDLK